MNKLLLISLLLIAAYSQAQEMQSMGMGTISGVIIDSATGQPVAFAAVSLALQGTDKEINGMVTDDKGVFSLTNIAFGTYKLSVFSVNYRKGIKDSIVINKTKTNVNIGDIKLSSATAKLGQVIVAADKNTVEYKIDKTVYNVDKDITSQTGVATDVLKKIPEVEVDVDGNVELQGNPDIQFLINGKPSTIFGNNLADVLQSIPASQIQSIEVITSPGAKYEAEGTAGIINIILKKSTAQGINGSVSLSGGTRLENGSINLNARKGNFGAHAFVSGNAQLTSATIYNLNRTGQDTASTTSRLIQNGMYNFRREGYQSGIGFDWEITRKDNLTGGVGYNYFSNNYTGTATSATSINNASGNLLSETNDLIDASNGFTQQTIDWNVEYKRIFHTKQQELDILVNSSYSNNYSFYTQTQLQPLSPQMGAGGNDSLLNSSYGNNPGLSKQTDLSVDYAQPLGNDILLETGTRATLQEINSNSNVYLFVPASDNYSFSSNQSSSLNYNCNVYAGYLSGTFKLFNWLKAMAGARYEYTGISAAFSNAGNVDIQPYGTFIPSAIFAHDFKDNQSLKLAYTRRIQRPNYNNLNPFINASDPENISSGNPALQPEIGDKIELGYNKILTKGGNINITLFFRDNTHDIQPYTTYYPSYKIGDSTYSDVSVTVPENIGHETNLGASIFGSIPIKKKLTLRSNIMLFQRYIYTGLPAGGNISGFNYRLNLNATYKFNKKITIELFGNYNSPKINAQGTYPAFYTYNFAIRKQIFNANGSIALTATNPFNYYMNQVTTLSGENFTLVTARALPYQSFGFNFNYKFGNLEFKNEKEQEDANLKAPEED